MLFNFLNTFFNTLNKNNINYCVLRNFSALPHSLEGSDLDILIAKRDLENFYLLLNEVLKKSNAHIIISYGKLTPRLCILGGRKSEWFGLQIDIHEGILPHRTQPMFPADLILERKKTHKGIFVADENDANILAFLKEILNNKKCKKSNFLSAKTSWKNNKHFYEKILMEHYNKYFIKALEEVFQEKIPSQEKIEFLAQTGRKILAKSWNAKFENLKADIARLNRFIHPPGFTIAFLGTDGAGKTTIIDAISSPLKEAVHNALYYEHMRPNFIPSIASLMGKKKPEGPVTDPHASKPSGPMGSLFRLFYYSFDYFFGYWIKIYPSLVKKSSIWIFDRYYYDYIIDPLRSRISLNKNFLNKFFLVFPKPDLILCLGTAPETIHNRKPELPFEEVKRQTELLKELSQREKNAVWIDTGQSLEKTIETTLNAIIHTMKSRYPEKVTKCL